MPTRVWSTNFSVRTNSSASCRPVSYTHLDVYKRQAVNCVVAGEAASGQEGLEQIQNLQPDIVITDIRMPDMDGLEMLAAGQAECPFDAIIISGYSEFEYAQQAIHLGVSEYLLLSLIHI